MAFDTAPATRLVLHTGPSFAEVWAAREAAEAPRAALEAAKLLRPEAEQRAERAASLRAQAADFEAQAERHTWWRGRMEAKATGALCFYSDESPRLLGLAAALRARADRCEKGEGW